MGAKADSDGRSGSGAKLTIGRRSALPFPHRIWLPVARTPTARSEVTPGSSWSTNHRALYSHRSNAAHRSHARRTSRMSDHDTRPLFAHRNDSHHHGAQSVPRAQVNPS